MIHVFLNSILTMKITRIRHATSKRIKLKQRITVIAHRRYAVSSHHMEMGNWNWKCGKLNYSECDSYKHIQRDREYSLTLFTSSSFLHFSGINCFVYCCWRFATLITISLNTVHFPKNKTKTKNEQNKNNYMKEKIASTAFLSDSYSDKMSQYDKQNGYFIIQQPSLKHLKFTYEIGFGLQRNLISQRKT